MRNETAELAVLIGRRVRFDEALACRDCADPADAEPRVAPMLLDDQPLLALALCLTMRGAQSRKAGSM
jgi:hypothetical protein